MQEFPKLITVEQLQWWEFKKKFPSVAKAIEELATALVRMSQH